MILMSMAVKTASKAAVNLASRSRMRNREARHGVVEVHEQVASLLGEPGPGGVGGDAEDVHSTGGVFDDEERVEPVQGDRVEVEQVAGQDCLGLRAEELRPGWSGAPRGGIDPGRVQDLPDGGGADSVAKSGEFAVDAPIPPGRILGGQAQDQRADTGGDGGSTRAGVRGSPAAADQLSVPAQNCCRCDQQSETAMNG
jgi:hypothetical protein